jgi:hypothetical protein
MNVIFFRGVGERGKGKGERGKGKGERGILDFLGEWVWEGECGNRQGEAVLGAF